MRRLAAREHVLAAEVQANVMPAAQPANGQGIVVAVVMRIDLQRAAHLARALAQPSSVQRLLHEQMRRVFRWIGPAPVRLAGIAVEHALSVPVGLPRVNIRQACLRDEPSRTDCTGAGRP